MAWGIENAAASPIGKAPGTGARRRHGRDAPVTPGLGGHDLAPALPSRDQGPHPLDPAARLGSPGRRKRRRPRCCGRRRRRRRRANPRARRAHRPDLEPQPQPEPRARAAPINPGQRGAARGARNRAGRLPLAVGRRGPNAPWLARRRRTGAGERRAQRDSTSRKRPTPERRVMAFNQPGHLRFATALAAVEPAGRARRAAGHVHLHGQEQRQQNHHRRRRVNRHQLGFTIDSSLLTGSTRCP